MVKKQKLELTWIGKENRTKLEPRVLIEREDLSYHAKHRVSRSDIYDNLLIHGDNLLALKAIEHEYTGKIKCIYIDPPYNTGSAFEHYDDGVEHSLWLSLMRDRLEILKKLLSEDGSIWISIDDNELAYLKILLDEVFGRNNFICNVIWQKVYTVKNSARHLSDMHDYILVYAKNGETWRPNLLPRTEKADSGYSNPDDDPRGDWTTNAIQARNYYSKGSYKIESPSGKIFTPPDGTYWRISEESFKALDDDNRVWWGANGDAIPRIKKFLSEAKQGIVPATLWFYYDVGHNAEAKIEVRRLFSGFGDMFITPKPERLIERILTLATKPGDLVLDSFLGSGTTAAVAHKMHRRWIGIELGDHCYTHCVPRLQKVVSGEDKGGISVTQSRKAKIKLCKSCNDSLCEKCQEKVGTDEKGGVLKWKGGGGFRFYELGPSLISQDHRGNPVVNPKFNSAMLAEAMCKLEGFTYAPSDESFWIHGHSTETDFIYVTTQFMSREMLTKISDEVGADRSLLVCCTAFKCDPEEFTNLTLKKIPKAVLKKCEWGHDDYSLAVENLPEATPEPEPEPNTQATKQARKFGKTAQQASLFDQPQGDE